MTWMLPPTTELCWTMVTSELGQHACRAWVMVNVGLCKLVACIAALLSVCCARGGAARFAPAFGVVLGIYPMCNSLCGCYAVVLGAVIGPVVPGAHAETKGRCNVGQPQPIM